MIKSKKIIITFTFFCLTLLLQACSFITFTDLPTGNAEAELDLDNKPNLRGLFPNSGLSNGEFADSYTTRTLEELTGFKVKYEQVLETDMSNTMSNHLVNNEQFNFVKLDNGSYETLAGKNSFLDLRPYLEKYGKDLLEIIPQRAWDAVTTEQGEILGIPEIGYAPMQSFAFVWNKSHLVQAGVTKVPETVGEIMDAFEKLKNTFSHKTSYRVFGLSGSQADIDILSPAFDIPDGFFVNDEGKIENVIYHENYISYMKFMNNLVHSGYLPKEWEGTTGDRIIANFASENISCGYLSYWVMNTLYATMEDKNDPNGLQKAKDNIVWTTSVRGDGTHGSVEQTEARKKISYDIGYVTVIPSYMAETAAYTIYWLNQKITSKVFGAVVGGKEGVHYTVVDENTPKAIHIKYDDVDEYRLLTDKFVTEVSGNSQYQTGVNPEVATALWYCREQQYNAWPIIFEDNGNSISNPLTCKPIFEHWSAFSIAAPTWVLTLEQKIINDDPSKVENMIKSMRNTYKKRYWTEEVDLEINTWFQSKNRG